jgi:hypothetical protein
MRGSDIIACHVSVLLYRTICSDFSLEVYVIPRQFLCNDLHSPLQPWTTVSISVITILVHPSGRNFVRAGGLR